MVRPIDVLVLNARLRQSLATVRSLGHRGLAVAAVDTVADVPAFRSRWCRSHFVCPAAEGTAASLAYLEGLLDRLGAPMLVPSHDGTIALLRQHRARLEQRVNIALASEPAMAIAVNKDRTLAWATRLGINVPRSVSITTVSEVASAIREIGLPAVVKPTESWMSNGDDGTRMTAQLVTTLDEARNVVATLERAGGGALLQPLLSGRREAVSFLYANGRMYARFAQWAKRMNPPLGGESTLRQSIPVPSDIGQQAERLVRAIELEGYSEVEFRRDAAGVPYLMEINPRLSASIEIAVRSGVDFPSLLYQWANGDPIDHVRGYRSGRWMRYLQGDLTSTIASLEQRGRPGVPSPMRIMVSFALTFLRPMRYDYFDWNDPRPAIKAMADLADEVTQSAGRVVRATLSRLNFGREGLKTTDTPTSSRSVPHYDAVVVGAGPYGLSTAAHLIGRGLAVGVFGKTLELWRERMPKGMFLRSHWWATNLSDPHERYGFDRFLGEAGYALSYPMPLQRFVEYGHWFQQRAVPNVDETYVSSIERREGGFRLTLDDGRTVTSAAVVLAIGVAHYAHRPEQYDNLPSLLVSHSCDHKDFTRFNGRHVVVVGGGQSAIEYAALLHEAGASVHVVARRPLVWLDRDRVSERTILERIRAPRASIAPGWQNWALDHVPYLFYRFPQRRKDSYNSNYFSGAAEWLRSRVIGSVTVHEGHTISALETTNGTVHARISDGTTITADHVLLATGYKVDARRLSMIHPSLLEEIRTDNAVPLLNHRFESTVPGLYFVGLTSLRAFGPLYRFVAGCTAAARRVAGDLARGARRK